MKTDNTKTPTLEEIQTATAALHALHAKTAFLRSLTPAERRQFGRMGAQAVRATVQRLEAARKHRDALPPAFDLRRFERETALLVALNDCHLAATRIQADMRDTLLSLGSGTVQSGKQVYALIQAVAAASDNLGRTVGSLKQRSRASRRDKDAPPSSGQTQPQAPPSQAAAVQSEVTPDGPSSEGKKAA